MLEAAEADETAQSESNAAAIEAAASETEEIIETVVATEPTAEVSAETTALAQSQSDLEAKLAE